MGACRAQCSDPILRVASDNAGNANNNKNGANLGFEASLFRAADKLRGNMEPSDYKHVALGLIFLRHISDSFEAKRAQLIAEWREDRKGWKISRRGTPYIKTDGCHIMMPSATRTMTCRRCSSTAMATSFAPWTMAGGRGPSPWCLTKEGERRYGRGTADNKGQHTSSLRQRK